MVTCYIGIGSNLGDRKYYIDKAIKEIRMLGVIKVKKISRIIETLPQGGPFQGPYLNGVLEIGTQLSPYQLLQELQKIETALGRVRTVANGPRTIDLDILTYAGLRIKEDALCIPHPRILERDFVLIPLNEIAPEVVSRLKKEKSKTGKPRLKKKIIIKKRSKTKK